MHNPDLISIVYEKGLDLLLAKWGNKDNIDQMILAIHNAFNEGLNTEFKAILPGLVLLKKKTEKIITHRLTTFFAISKIMFKIRV